MPLPHVIMSHVAFFLFILSFENFVELEENSLAVSHFLFTSTVFTGVVSVSVIIKLWRSVAVTNTWSGTIKGGQRSKFVASCCKLEFLGGQPGLRRRR